MPDVSFPCKDRSRSHFFTASHSSKGGSEAGMKFSSSIMVISEPAVLHELCKIRQDGSREFVEEDTILFRGHYLKDS